MHPLVSLEDHFLSSVVAEDPAIQETWSMFPAHQKENLLDVGPRRLADMNSGGLNLQVVSHVPYEGTAAQCQSINDDVASRIASPENKGRLAAFAVLPMRDPPAAAKELRRCVQELKFPGALIDNHLEDGTFYDDERFWTVFEEAQALDVAIYLHPTFPSEEQNRRHAGNYSKITQMMLGISGWGWHADTGLHVLRLYAAGLFDKFPGLKLVIGHMGELLPFQLERTMSMTGRGLFGKRERSLKEVWDSNIWITTSGMFSVNPLACVLRNTRKDRIMYSVDYPFSTNKTGLDFMEALGKSGMVTDEELAMIGYKNALQLLKLELVH